MPLNVSACHLVLYFYNENPETFIKSGNKNTLDVKSAYPHAPIKDRAAFYTPTNTTAALMSNPRCFHWPFFTKATLHILL